MSLGHCDGVVRSLLKLWVEVVHRGGWQTVGRRQSGFCVVALEVGQTSRVRWMVRPRKMERKENKRILSSFFSKPLNENGNQRESKIKGKKLRDENLAIF